jgi:hypothetical protein
MLGGLAARPRSGQCRCERPPRAQNATAAVPAESLMQDGAGYAHAVPRFANSAHLLDGGDLPWRVGNERSDALDASQHAWAWERLAVAPAPPVALSLGKLEHHQITVTALGVDGWRSAIKEPGPRFGRTRMSRSSSSSSAHFGFELRCLNLVRTSKSATSTTLGGVIQGETGGGTVSRRRSRGRTCGRGMLGHCLWRLPCCTSVRAGSHHSSTDPAR